MGLARAAGARVAAGAGRLRRRLPKSIDCDPAAIAELGDAHERALAHADRILARAYIVTTGFGNAYIRGYDDAIAHADRIANAIIECRGDPDAGPDPDAD